MYPSIEQKSKQEAEQEQKRVHRILTFSIIGSGLIDVIFSGYFYLGYSDDPLQCVAMDNQDRRVIIQGSPEAIQAAIDSSDQYVDVGARFFKIFAVTYWLGIAQLLAGLVHSIGDARVRDISKFIATFSSQVDKLTFLIAVVLRFLHSG